jgi:hypothetical protein
MRTNRLGVLRIRIPNEVENWETRLRTIRELGDITGLNVSVFIGGFGEVD